MPTRYPVRALAGDSVPAPFDRAFDYGTYRLARWYGLQATGGSMSVRSTGRFGMTRRRRGGQGDADRRGGGAFRRRRVGVHGQPLARDQPRSVRQVRQLRRARRRRRQAASALAPDAEEPGQLHHPAHGAAPASTSPPRSTAARSTASTSRCRACSMPPSRSRRSTAASSCPWTPRPPRRCRA